MDNKTIYGFVSVKSVIEAKSRDIEKIYIERGRYEKAMRSKLSVTEQRRYASILASGAECVFVSEDEFAALAPEGGSGGIAALVGPRRFTPAQKLLSMRGGYIAVLDGIEDPFNFAYALRSLYAAGVDGVILPERNFYEASDTFIRSSAGASEKINACCVPSLAEACAVLKRNGYMIVSTAKTSEAKDLYRCRFNRPLCVVYGGEKRGISKEIIDISDEVVKIKYPRDCHYSLPACSAVSIISFEIARKLSRYTPEK